jgi:hypothetical protein
VVVKVKFERKLVISPKGIGRDDWEVVGRERARNARLIIKCTQHNAGSLIYTPQNRSPPHTQTRHRWWCNFPRGPNHTTSLNTESKEKSTNRPSSFFDRGTPYTRWTGAKHTHYHADHRAEFHWRIVVLRDQRLWRGYVHKNYYTAKNISVCM